MIEISREDFDRYTKTSAETRNELRRKWRARNLLYAKNLLRLQRNVKVRTLKKGEYVYKEGQPATSMFRVDDNAGGKYKTISRLSMSFTLLQLRCLVPSITGELEVLHGGTKVHKYVPGDSFGESSLLFGKPRS